jgi:c(7)-type cytochrome triheme protein
MGRRLCALLVLLLAVAGCVNDGKEKIRGSEFDDMWNMPKLPPPPQYGNVLISRLTRSSTHPPVAFSHWVHRRYFTCRVCHFELNFALKTNTTEITEAKNRKGEFCGACHNNKTAFGISDETCTLCHTGNIGASDGRFSELKDFPKALYGDQINWTKALKRGLITPKQSIIDPEFQSIPFEQGLRLNSEWQLAKTRAVFPHQKHIEWLDCADCHPDIFNIQKKGTKHFRMDNINRGMFCGACHLTVAFPVQDCRRCHPDLK